MGTCNHCETLCFFALGLVFDSVMAGAICVALPLDTRITIDDGAREFEILQFTDSFSELQPLNNIKLRIRGIDKNLLLSPLALIPLFSSYCTNFAM